MPNDRDAMTFNLDEVVAQTARMAQDALAAFQARFPSAQRAMSQGQEAEAIARQALKAAQSVSE